MQEILEVIDSYGIDTVVLALIINVLTVSLKFRSNIFQRS